MIVFRRWLGLALIVMALLLTACGASTQTAEPVATSEDHQAEASTGSEDHEDEEANAHEGEEADGHEGEEADSDEGEEADTDEGEEADTDEGEEADAHEGEEPDAHEGEEPDAHESEDEHEGEDADTHEDEEADAHEGEDEHEGQDADTHDASREDEHEGEDPDTHEGEDEHAHDVKGLPELEAVTLADGERLRVVATTSIVGDVVAQVGRDAIDLTVLLAPGQDPHAYQPSAQDLATAAQAHLIFVNGFDLEENLLQDLESAAEGVPIVPVSVGIEPIAGKEDEEEEGEEGGHEHAHAEDPHVWFDVAKVEQWTDNVEAALGQLDPKQADTYEANAEAYRAQLKELDDLVRETVSAIPATNRKLVTNHDSLGYFANAYGFDIIGTVIPNLSSNAEPSASDLSQLIETIKQEQVPAIFIDSSASDELAQVVADETGAAVLALYSETLGAEGSGADSYLGMMRTNVERIEEGLGTQYTVNSKQ